MRRLAVFAGAFSGGIFLAQFVLPGQWLLPLAAVCLALMGGGFFLRGHARLRLFLICAGLGLALAYDWAYTAAVQAPAEALAGTERTGVTMTVLEHPETARYGAKVTVRLKLSDLRFGKAVFYGDESLLELRPGNTITGDVSLRSAAHIREDDLTVFTSNGVYLLAYGGDELTAGEGSARSPRWWPARLGQALRDSISTVFDAKTAPFLAAILTGDRSGLPAEDSIALSEAGLLHLLAVSGMHCAFLLSMVTVLLGYQRRRLRAALAIPVLLFYTVLTGASPSVVRACVMMIFLLSAPLFRRESDGPTALSAALLLILVQNPFAAASVSLQLSFGAVAGILWLTPKVYRGLLGKRRRPGRIVRFLAGSLSASLGAMVFTVPLTAAYFNIFVLAAPVSNLLCLPAAGMVFGMGLLAAVTGLFCPALGSVLAILPGLLTRYILWVAAGISRIPWHAVYFSDPYLKYWLAFVYLLFGLAYVLRGGARLKYTTAVVLSGVTLAATVSAWTDQCTAGRLDVTVLDVGQGACTVLSSGGHFALIDCGSGSSWYDAGQLAADTLQSRCCFRLDDLLLTHYDYDHVSGVVDVLARLRVETLLVPDVEDDSGLRETVLSAAERCGVTVEFVRQRRTLELGDAVLTVYPPVGRKSDNQSGLSCLVTSEDYDLLVTGDMDSATERTLLNRYGLPDIEALVVGHHGSKNAASRELLETLRPETAIISVGAGNAYGHPADETLGRLLDAGAEVYRTDRQGNIHITVN